MQEVVAPPGRGRMTRRVLALCVVAVIVVAVALTIGFRNSVALTALRSVAHGYGYDVNAQMFDVNLGELKARHVRVQNASGEPVFEARAIDVAYSLRDVLPGGKRLFGLESIDVDAPHVTAIHHVDGSYNITIPQSGSTKTQAAPAPLNVRLRITGGTIDVIDRFIAAPRERRERISSIAANGVISPASGSYYHAGAVLEDGARRYPIRGNARFDDPRGYELQHWTSAKLPIATLANFVLASRAVIVQAGEIRNVDATLGALSTPAGPLQTHLGLRADLSGGRIAAAALAKPIRDAHGSFVVDDDSATVRSIDATLNGIPLRVSGVLYHFAAPQVAFALTARGSLRQVRALSMDSASLPLDGTITLHGVAEGPAANPLIFARVGSSRIDYGTYRLDAARGLVAISGNELDVLAAAIRYGPASVAGRGSLLLQAHTRTEGYATFAVPADGLPFVNRIVPGMPLAGIGVVSGSDAKLAARGYLGGADGGDRLDVPFALAASGSGTVGPVVLQRRDGASVYARAAIDRQANQTVALVDVRGLSLEPGPVVTLPGLSLPVVPPHVDAKVDVTFAGLALGSSLATASGALHAAGTWGDVRLTAAGSAQNYAARGRLASSFERLEPFTGNVGAHGGIDVPFALFNRGRTTIAQIDGAQFSHASILGVTLQGADATLGLRLPAVDVYSADVRVADRDVTAAGSFGNGGSIHLTAGDIDLRALRGVGSPLSSGHATAIADIGGTLAKPVGNVVAALAGARYASTDVGGDVGLAYAGGTIRIDRATVTYGGAYANASGAVDGLALGHIAPRYAIRARLEDADIATLAHVVKNPLRYPEGTLDADVFVGGAGSQPSVRGALQVPEGSLNGLNFSAARVGFAGDTSAIAANDGRITVGSTTVGFGGSASRTRQRVRVQSPRIDLADFNDYFDEAEVLAGTGSVALAFDATPNALATSANLQLRDARYRRFDFGTATATVQTAGRAIHVRAGIDGSNGQLTVAGSINVPQTNPLNDIVRRSYVDFQTQITGIDLGNVLPAAGVNVPLFGVIDATANVRGRYPALALATHAALTHGVAGRVPIERFTIAATAANGRGRITDATLIAPGLTANLSGAFGLRPQDAFDLRARADSGDLNELISAATGKSLKVKGSLGVQAHATGTIVQPRLSAAVDVGNVGFASVSLPGAHADVTATRAAVDIRNGSLTLGHGGSIAFDGHAPLGGGAATPIALDFAPHHVDVASYSDLLPDSSKVAGVLDGNVGVRGTLSAPRLNGNLAFVNGAFHSNTLKSGLTAMVLDLDFSGTTVRVSKLHAHAAPGNIDGSGTLTLRDFRDPVRGLSANVNLSVANALISAPKFFAGYVDGTITAQKKVASAATVGGDLTFSSARIPYTALLPSGGSSTGAAPVLPDVAFDLGVNLGRDVRVQSGPVDIGTTGSARLGGTLAKPTLNGAFSATDGTVSLYRTFVVQSGSAVNFDAADGITPSVDATAVTSIPDPPTDVLLHVTGPSTHLNLAFSSEPAYSQQQILGLLVNAQALGAVAGVAQSSGAPSNGPTVSGLGAGLLNDQLTQKFLQPFSSKLGGALGLSDLNVNYNTNGAVSAAARRKIGKNISFVYGEQIGGPQPRTSLGIDIGNSISGAQLTFYQAAGSQQAFGGQALTPFLQSGFLATSPPNYTLQAIEPPTGSGFVFSYQRRFW